MHSFQSQSLRQTIEKKQLTMVITRFLGAMTSTHTHTQVTRRERVIGWYRREGCAGVEEITFFFFFFEGWLGRAFYYEGIHSWLVGS